MEDIRLACAYSEYVDSSEFQFEKGVLEYYDTATSTVRRNATPEELKDAKRKRKAAERKGEALLKKKTRPVDGSTTMHVAAKAVGTPELQSVSDLSSPPLLHSL